MEQLILELNSPANQSFPERVHDIQKQIQLLQREKSAWQTGLDFLHNEQAIIRFYGALTLTIKINTDWEEDGLSEDEILRTQLLESLLNSYVQLTGLPDASFVLQKICGTISTFFLKAYTNWKQPIRCVLASLLNGSYIAGESINSSEAFHSSLMKLNYYQLRGILWLCSDLAEDIGRLDSSTSNGNKALLSLSENGGDVWTLIYACLQQAVRTPSDAKAAPQLFFSSQIEKENAVKLILQMIPLWTPHAPSRDPDMASADSSTTLPLNQTISLILECFNSASLTDATLQLLTTLFQNFPRLMQSFQKASRNAITSLIGSHRAFSLLTSLAKGEFSPEGLHYVELLDVLLDQEYTTEHWWHSENVRIVLSQLRQLMVCPGVAVIEDEICQPVLEIFSKVVEATLDMPSASEDSELRGLIFDISEFSMAKAAYPIEEMNSSTSTWDADDRARFHDFRQDVQDFLHSAFALGGDTVAGIAAASLRAADSQSDWTRFEACVFSMSALLDSLSGESEQLESHIVPIFDSQMWSKIIHNTASTPDRARQGAIKFVALNTIYLQRHPDSMVSCLNFLFSSLHLRGSTTAAARAIYKLCQSQGQLLVGALPQFIASLQDISTLEPSDRHRVYGSVAAIIQAKSSEQDKLVPLSQVLDMMTGLVRAADSSDTGEEALSEAVDILQTLSSIGKGLRASTDSIIDLDAPANDEADFWTLGAGKGIQEGVLSICTSALRLPGAQTSSDVIEAACDLIKSGYPEQHPSPFKFSVAISLEFLTAQISLASPNIEGVMACASSFLASTSVPELRDDYSRLMAPLINAYEILFATFQTTGEVPDSSVSSSTFDFITRLLPKWGQTWLALADSQQSLALVIEIALIVLADQDTLPRRSAASLIAAIVDKAGPSSLSPPASTNLVTVIQAYDLRILGLLIQLLAGECARSELEALTEPFKRFVQKQSIRVKPLLREAMKAEAGVLGPKALSATTPEGRMRFVAQVEGLRGSKKTNEVVREFWISCRGSGFGYTV